MITVKKVVEIGFAVGMFWGTVCGNGWYVYKYAPAGGDGTSWATAFRTIEDAVDAASNIWIECTAPDAILIKQGTYTPAATIATAKALQIYGGYPSSIANPTTSDRDPAAYPTTLSGGSARRCLELSTYCVIDGLIFAHGRTTGMGAGIYIHSTPVDCGFLGILNTTIRNCRFTDNIADLDGGAIYDYMADAEIRNCTFDNNSAHVGGAIKVWESSPTIERCVFNNNTATAESGWEGGAICEDYYCYGTITNCLFYLNTTAGNGGALGFHIAHPTITNCTFAANTAGGFGGAYYGNTSAPTFRNCIFWDDTPTELYNFTASTATVSYSDVEGGYTGATNINLLPQFMGGTNYRLQSTSPCVDAGTNTGAPTNDLDSLSRPTDGDCNGAAVTDMGAYEFRYTNVGDSDGNCTINLLDFEILSEHWLLTDCGVCGGADYNNDNDVGVVDLAIQAANWLRDLP
jgi:hypothetical protein